MKRTIQYGIVIVSLAVATTASAQRDQIRIVGSSTVYPFSTKVAERFGQTTKFPTPVIESTGTGGGFKIFCQGIGAEHPDITNASRKIKDSEIAMCKRNGVADITEVKIGYDGIVLATAQGAPQLDLTPEQIYRALAKQLPTKEGKLVRNPNRTWKDVDPSLPATKIEVLGPPPTSGTRDAFVELVMEKGCQQYAWVGKLQDTDEDRFKAICHGVREDGAYIEAGENDNLIVQKLAANPKAVGIFGFSFLDQNRDRLQGAKIGGVEPTFETISSGKYPVSRPLFFYVKTAHVGRIPGIEAFVREFTSERAWGENGYLSDLGLIPLPEDERKEAAKKAQELDANVSAQR